MKACPLCGGSGKKRCQDGNYWLLKCTNCKFVYVDADDQEIEQVNFHYGDSVVQHYEEVQSGLDYLWFSRISERLTQGRSGLRVLDIGCGNGVLLRQFLKRGCICYGSDPSPWAQTCAEKYGYTMIPLIEKAQIEPSSFDIVTSTSTLEHVSRPLEHVSRIMEILKPGGIAYFTLPSYGSLPIRLHIVKGRFVVCPGHCSYFTRGTLKNLFRHESLVGQVASVRVRSYGIPEIHGIYRKLVRHKPGPVKQQNKTSPVQQQNDLMKGILVSFYYWVGTPFGFGDKLEAIVTKTQ
jgi:2-polyprenyl-3-methyl-5-hydroxy-6-metoxy-1,4-benzoquinol methylase